jgi:hypothetical protein
MGNSKWFSGGHQRNKQPVSRRINLVPRVAGPTCPLCGKEIRGSDRAETVMVNGKPVLLHRDCPQGVAIAAVSGRA